MHSNNEQHLDEAHAARIRLLLIRLARACAGTLFLLWALHPSMPMPRFPGLAAAPLEISASQAPAFLISGAPEQDCRRASDQDCLRAAHRFHSSPITA